MRSNSRMVLAATALAMLSVYMAVPSSAEEAALPQSKAEEGPPAPSVEDQLRDALGQCRANLDFIRKEATAEAANKSGLATKIDRILSQPMPGEGEAAPPVAKGKK